MILNGKKMRMWNWCGIDKEFISDIIACNLCAKIYFRLAIDLNPGPQAL